MATISKPTCSILTGLLASYGIERAVVSPGSRNAPLLVSMERSGNFAISTVVDERTAAFVALGMAKQTSKPVALVCTSGSAMLNYGPALAEAYYSRTPLIAITADRPGEWIDQRDSQTIRQNGALDAVVRKSVEIDERMSLRQVNRLINEALTAAAGNIPGPAHINVPLGAPLTTMAQESEMPVGNRISTVRCRQEVPDDVFRLLTSSKKIMFIAGAGADVNPLSVRLPDNSVWFSDRFGGEQAGISALAAGVLLNRADDEKKAMLRPDFVVNLGGTLIDDKFKACLRRWQSPVINIGFDDNMVDTFGSLHMQIECNASDFVEQWNAYVCRNYGHTVSDQPGYCRHWRDFISASERGVAGLPWCDIEAMRMLAMNFNGGELFASNGMCARYAQLMPWKVDRIHYNRGVSGIDGCTSTAAGISMATERTVLLLTGDMSFGYDIGALVLKNLRGNFKIAVFDNGGGDIFRHVATTASLPERETRFAVPVEQPVAQLATAFGFDYYLADGNSGTADALVAFLRDSEKPAILHIITDIESNQKAYNILT